MVTKLAVAFLLLTDRSGSVQAYIDGGGSCEPGVPFASYAPHSLSSDGELAAGGFRVLINGEVAPQDGSVVEIVAGEDVKVELEGANDAEFRGFFMRLEGSDECDTGEAWKSFEVGVQDAWACPANIGGLTHVNNDFKTRVQGIFNYGCADAPYLALDVTAVSSFSTWYNTNFRLYPGCPNTAPSPSPMETTPTPTGSPIQTPTTTPVTRTLCPNGESFTRDVLVGHYDIPHPDPDSFFRIGDFDIGPSCSAAADVAPLMNDEEYQELLDKGFPFICGCPSADAPDNFNCQLCPDGEIPQETHITNYLFWDLKRCELEGQVMAVTEDDVCTATTYGTDRQPFCCPSVAAAIPAACHICPGGVEGNWWNDFDRFEIDGEGFQWCSDLAFAAVTRFSEAQCNQMQTKIDEFGVREACECPYPAPITSPATASPTLSPTPASTPYPGTPAPTKQSTTASPTPGSSNVIPLNRSVRKCTSNDPCDECEGDCGRDSHCSGDLVCFKKNRGEAGDFFVVPGCYGEDTTRTDWCVKPESAIPSASPTPPPSPEAQWVPRGNTILGSDEDQLFGFCADSNKDGTIIVSGSIRNSDAGTRAGSVSVYQLVDDAWEELGNPILGNGPTARFGWSCALSDAGDTLVVGSRLEHNENGPDASSVRVFKLKDGDWCQVGSAVMGEKPRDRFGEASAISGNGTVVAGGAQYHDHDGRDNVGQVRVYRLVDHDQWEQVGQTLYGSNQNQQFGAAMELSYNGTVLSVASADGSFDVFKYTRDGGGWNPIGSVLGTGIASPPDIRFGVTVALSPSADYLVAASPFSDNYKGSVRVFHLENRSWIQMGTVLQGEVSGDVFGSSVRVISSDDAVTVAVGASAYLTNIVEGVGYLKAFQYDGEDWNLVGDKLVAEGPIGDAWGGSIFLTEGEGGLVVGSGAHGNDNNGENVGQVRVFELENP